MSNIVYASFKETKTRHAIRDMDQLQFRKRGLISIAGRGDHSHSAKAAWWGEDLFCLEVREWVGGRAVTLESQVKRFPGRIDVYQTNPSDYASSYDRKGAVAYMRRLCGCQYGWGAIVQSAMVHLPGVRLFAKVDTSDNGDVPHRPPFCSAACALADHKGGGIDPVPYLANRMTEPADLSRSLFYKYLFTLTP
jgi:hypothetical protein